ncbi:MAG TPA: hypothetical protein VMM78_04795, partial [Thermomicrobiales bacterium]|nr:hypothetical protein [Thermomicrobiales bacterium]
MTRRWIAALPYALCGATIAMVLPIVVLAVANRHEADFWAETGPTEIVVALAYSVVGALLATRQRSHAIGWLFLAIGLFVQLSALALQWATYGLETRSGLAGAALALWASLWFGALGLVLPATFPLLLFPSGHLTSWFARIVAWVSGGATAVLVGALMTGNEAPPGFPELFERTPNPLALSQPIFDPGIAIMVLGLCGVASVVMLLVRFRRSRGDTRQQYKWVVAAMAFVAAAFVADFVARASESGWHVASGVGMSLAFVLMPVAMLVAILRYRLWDIDLIIGRTIVYSALTASLFATYLALILALGALGRAVAGYDSTIGVAISTLAVAALGRPLRARIQGAVDRRFYRRRYDAAR